MKEDTKIVDRRTFLRYMAAIDAIDAMAGISSLLPAFAFPGFKNREVLTPKRPDNAIDLVAHSLELPNPGIDRTYLQQNPLDEYQNLSLANC